ncbi:MAG TPA: 4Fe-4S dicluster domain-containing protein [Candidatus Polarisedimenticolaceae bacterium]|nr:4Fe-4S dicluster domain-containing protein [Candidatus Polarisedimenticolaceae bacterium]
MKPAILNDLTRCIGCEACVWACREVNELPVDERADRLSSGALSAVERRGDVFVRRQCMHCLEPACVSVCPVAALHKTPEGPVVYDASRCIGCRYCMIGCPFGIPRYEWDDPTPKVQKCTMCFARRLQHGEQPACTAACPTGAALFGDRDALIEEAQRRIREEPDRYVDHVYGVQEAGGTSVIYLSAVPFADLGFETTVANDPYPRLTWQVLSKIPNVVSVAGVLLFGIWWLTGRKELIQRVHDGRISLEQAMREMPSFSPPEHDHDN